MVAETYEGYRDMIDSLGHEIVLYEDEEDYEGDSWYLLRDGARYGILEFGWGSCAGCDAFQACGTDADFEELRAGLAQAIRWGTLAETGAYLREHDWDGSWSGRSAACKRFRARALAFVDQADAGKPRGKGGSGG